MLVCAYVDSWWIALPAPILRRAAFFLHARSFRYCVCSVIAQASVRRGEDYVQLIRTLIDARVGSWLQPERNDQIIADSFNLDVFKSISAAVGQLGSGLGKWDLDVEMIAAPECFIIV